MKFTNLLLGVAVAGALTVAPAARAAAAADVSKPAPQASAKTFTHEGAGVTFELPAGWTAEPDGDQLTVSPADDSVALVFWVTEEDDFDAAAKALGEELAKQIKNLKLDGEPKADKHNGMDHAAVSGSGQVDGKDILFSADILAANKPLIVLTMGSLENLQKHAAEYSQLVKSIKRVGGASAPARKLEIERAAPGGPPFRFRAGASGVLPCKGGPGVRTDAAEGGVTC